MTRSESAANMASEGRAISIAAASLGNAALANAPKQAKGGGYFGDGTPRCRRPYFARLANAARALHWRQIPTARATNVTPECQGTKHIKLSVIFGRMEGWMDGWMDGWMANACMDGCMDGWMDG
eukprot:364020-Chlamydomonas_euryale.AAC.8